MHLRCKCRCEEVGSREGGEEAGDLVAAEDSGEVVGAAGANCAGGRVEGNTEGMAVEEEESGEGLVLPEGHPVRTAKPSRRTSGRCGPPGRDGRDGVSSGRDVQGHREVGEEGLDCVGAEGAGVLEAVEAEETADPVQVGGFGAQ